MEVVMISQESTTKDVKLFGNVTRVRVESRLCDQGPRKNDAPSISATLPTISSQAQTIAVFDLIRGQTLYSICPIRNPS